MLLGIQLNSTMADDRILCNSPSSLMDTHEGPTFQWLEIHGKGRYQLRMEAL